MIDLKFQYKAFVIGLGFLAGGANPNQDEKNGDMHHPPPSW